MAPLIPIKKILEPLYIAPSPANNETLTLYFLLCSASSSYIQSNVVLVHPSWFAFCMFFWHHCRSDFESKDPCILPPWKLSHQIIGKHSAVPSKFKWISIVPIYPISLLRMISHGIIRNCLKFVSCMRTHGSSSMYLMIPNNYLLRFGLTN